MLAASLSFMTAPLNIILYQPEIPPNTGNIARLCACTGCHLHLIHPLGFEISDRTLRRAGLDYWKHLTLTEHACWQDFLDADCIPGTMHAFTTKGRRTLWDCRFEPGDALLFGPESRGLPDGMLGGLNCVRLPMRQDAPVRSLNLSSACAVAVYEAFRQWRHHPLFPLVLE